MGGGVQHGPTEKGDPFLLRPLEGHTAFLRARGSPPHTPRRKGSER